MNAKTRVALLAVLVVGELAVMARYWRTELTDRRTNTVMCGSLTSSIETLLSYALGEPGKHLLAAAEADEPSAHPVARRVEHYLDLAGASRPTPHLANRPIARRVDGLDFVPGPAMACTVFVLTDPDPTVEHVVLRQFLDGTVRERVVEPSRAGDFDRMVAQLVS